MTSDEERRRVAKALRERTKRPLGKSMQLMFSETLGLYRTNIGWAKPEKATETWANIVNYLADLIDRPTCTVSMGVTGHVGVCMRCGAMIETSAAVFNAIEALPTRYCPNCGAKLAGESASRAVTQQR